jgi:hypothetical protein
MEFRVKKVKKVFGGYDVTYFMSKFDHEKKKIVNVESTSFYSSKIVQLGVPKDQLHKIRTMYVHDNTQKIMENTSLTEKKVVYLGTTR